MNLRNDKRPNIQGELDFSSAVSGEAQGTGGKEIESFPAMHEHESPASTDRMMEEICEWKNLKEAMWRVKANKGGPGTDGMTVDELPDYAGLLVIREQLLSGTYYTAAGETGGNPQTGRWSAQTRHSDRVGSICPASGDAGFAEAMGPDVFR